MRAVTLCLALAGLLAIPRTVLAQDGPAAGFTRADTLRGSWDTPGRRWWDVAFYDLNVTVSPRDSTISGYNRITYRVLEPGEELQVDLIAPLEIDSVVQDGRRLALRREGAAWFVRPALPPVAGAEHSVVVHYRGRPREAVRPPWDGGFTWSADSLGRPWVVTTDQGIGASVWWPNKDTQADEPDSQRITITVPEPMVNVANGRLRSRTPNGDGTITYEWFVTSPINNYAIAVNAGSYAHWSEVYAGEAGELTLDFWPLDYNLEKARRQWAQTRPMLQCFEHWFGPYPWYEDGFKLIEVPYPGMEHQSAVTYGNGFANGYGGRDLSGTGIGMQFDFIIIHEAAHEWFANSITAKDQADMWVHESFANYAEGLYAECRLGTEAGAAYTVGSRRGILNDRPIIPAYGVNAKGSGDMYPKGGNMLHTIRHIVADDVKWRDILRGLNRTFRHQTVTGAQIESYISEHAGIELGRVFDQYLRTTRIPVLEYRLAGKTLDYRWSDVVPGFDMPVRVTLAPGDTRLLRPREAWQSLTVKGKFANVTIDPNFYAVSRAVTPADSTVTR
ncbi:MAG TPA: M1 family metallopeptidase [Longimicrobiales bacterium]|nr:M1 family metallopeptidase [Longimicrobiales bacterium]